MGLYVEVMCDERKEWPADIVGRIEHRCWSNKNDSPNGRTVAEARREAKRQGWIVRASGYACCPGCKDPHP